MTRGAAGALAGASDTIVAEATAPGRGALAVIRLSGPRAHDIARRILDAIPTAARAPPPLDSSVAYDAVFA